jgi:gliding motility-associated-like protein
MQTKLFFRIIFGFIFLIGSQRMQAQNCNARIETEADGSVCGKTTVTISVKADDYSNLDLSKCNFVITTIGTGVYTPLQPGENKITLASGFEYTIRATGVKCNGKEFICTPDTIRAKMEITGAEYKRCSASDVSVSATVSGGKGPYKYQLVADGKDVEGGSGSSTGNIISFSASTSSSNLSLKVTDEGCLQNGSVTGGLAKTADYSAVMSVIKGDMSACKNETIELSVKSEYSGNNFEWKKGNNIVSTSKTLKFENISEDKAGKYTFSMNFDGCGTPFSEEFNIEVGSPSPPNVASPAYICLNSNAVSLSNYASVTSPLYTLVWYKSDASLIGETAPMFNPNLPVTGKYLVSQKNATGCESSKAELTIIVEELPATIAGSNLIICLSDNSKPKIRVVNAGNSTYNLYTKHSGGTKIGSGIAVNDTAIIETGQDLVIGNNYYLETENAHGCVSYERTTVPVKLKESLISGPEKVCFGDKLLLSTNYTGGKIVWTKPDNSYFEGKVLTIDSVEFKNAGAYSLRIEESGLSCIMRDEIQVKVTQPAPPYVAENLFRYYRGENAPALTARPKEGLSLKWYDPDEKLLSGQSPVPATDKEGVFVYHVSQDSLGCESPKVAITVTVGTIPSAVPASDINICIADKPEIQIKNTVQDYKYTVSCKNSEIAEGTGNGGTISLTSIVSITENAELEITVSDIYGVKSPVTKKNVTATASLIAESASVFCLGSDFQLQAIDIAGASYTWTLPDGSEYPGKSVPVTDAKSENSGIYTLALTTSGCPVVKVTKRVNVSQPASPVVDKDSYRFHENENATPLTATPKQGFTLKWYNPEGTLLSAQSPVPATNKTGTFVYHVSQDSLGCESPKVPVTVVIGEIPAGVPSSDINTCMADKPVIQIKNTVQDYKYTVYYKNNAIAEGKGNGGTISLTSGVSISENTELGITVTDIYNVSSIQTGTSLISVNNLIDMKNSSSSVCDGSSGKLIAVNITGATFAWTLPDGNTVNEESITVSNASSANAGTYTLSVTTSGCPVAKQTVELKVEKPAKPSTTKEIYFCTGDNATQLSASALPGYKTVWFNESQEQLPDAPVPNTSVAGTSAYYVLQVSISDANCSSDREEISVTVENKPDAMVLEPVNVCYASGDAQAVSVRVPSSSKGYIYSLYSMANGGSLAGQASSSDDNLPVDITINDSEIQSGKVYYLEIMNTAGCVSERTPVEVILTEIRLSPDELPPYQVDEFYSQKLETNAPGPKYSIVQGYLPVGFMISSAGDISGMASSYGDPATFTVEITSNLGCSIQKEYVLKSELLVSKMFSPNGDGINDIFMKGYKVIIFDRLGRKLCSSDNGWDGTFNGRVMPEDVYYYILYYKDKDGKEQRITSYVTLIKTI